MVEVEARSRWQGRLRIKERRQRVAGGVLFDRQVAIDARLVDQLAGPVLGVDDGQARDGG
jgi:hypothetical protein